MTRFSLYADMNRDEGLISEVEVIAVAVAVDPVQPVAVGLTRAVAVSRRADKGCQQHHRGAQVVLDRVGEEDRAQEESRESESISDPVGAALDLRLLDQVEKTVCNGDDRARADDKRADEHGVEEDAPGDSAESVTGRLRRAREMSRIFSRHAQISSSKER